MLAPRPPKEKPGSFEPGFSWFLPFGLLEVVQDSCYLLVDVLGVGELSGDCFHGRAVLGVAIPIPRLVDWVRRRVAIALGLGHGALVLAARARAVWIGGVDGPGPSPAPS